MLAVDASGRNGLSPATGRGGAPTPSLPDRLVNQRPAPAVGVDLVSARCSRDPHAGGHQVLLALLFLILLAMMGTGGAQAATPISGDNLHHAGLVVRHGDGRLTYAYVAFQEDEISGLQLLERTGIEQVTLPFGGLGAAVCSLEGEGCPAGECRRNVCQSGQDAPYWRYFRQTEPGMWQPAPLGASSARVTDGAIDAWVWTTADAGLPAIRMDDVRRLAGVAGNGVAASGEIPTAAVRSAYPPGPSDEAGGGSPATLVAGVGLIVLVALGGIFAVRRARQGTG